MSEPTSAHPTHVTLAVVLQVRGGELQVLLWQRARQPFRGAWALPGGYLSPGKTLEQSIRGHLAAKVDVRELSHLEQLETLSDPNRSPKEWQLATAYLGLVPSDLDPELPADTDVSPSAGGCSFSLSTRRAAVPGEGAALSLLTATALLGRLRRRA